MFRDFNYNLQDVISCLPSCPLVPRKEEVITISREFHHWTRELDRNMFRRDANVRRADAN